MEIVLGTLVKPLGLTGELKLQESEDFWAAALDSAKLHLVRGEERRPVQLEGARTHSAGMRALRLAGVTRREEAEDLVGAVLAIDAEGMDVPPPAEPRNFQRLGFEVRLPDDSILGRVEAILHLPAHPVFVVRSETREYLVPDVPAFVRELDLERRILRIEPVPGLLEL